MKDAVKNLERACRWFNNHFVYSVCMDEYEDTKGLFRVCMNNDKFIKCYKEQNEKVRKIKVNNKEYIICPKTVRFWKEEDYKKYKAG